MVLLAERIPREIELKSIVLAIILLLETGVEFEQDAIEEHLMNDALVGLVTSAIGIRPGIYGSDCIAHDQRWTTFGQILDLQREVLSVSQEMGSVSVVVAEAHKALNLLEVQE